MQRTCDHDDVQLRRMKNLEQHLTCAVDRQLSHRIPQIRSHSREDGHRNSALMSARSGASSKRLRGRCNCERLFKIAHSRSLSSCSKRNSRVHDMSFSCDHHHRIKVICTSDILTYRCKPARASKSLAIDQPSAFQNLDGCVTEDPARLAVERRSTAQRSTRQ